MSTITQEQTHTFIIGKFWIFQYLFKLWITVSGKKKIQKSEKGSQNNSQR